MILFDFFRKHIIFIMFLFFSIFFGWIIFEEIKSRQIYSDLSFNSAVIENIPSETEFDFSFNVKTDAMIRLHIPFLFSEDVSESDFSESIVMEEKSPLYVKKITRRRAGKAILALYFAEPVNIKSVKLACKKNISYLRNGVFFQTEQYGLPVNARFLFCFCYVVFILFIFAVFKCINLYIEKFSLKYFLTVVLLGIGCICIWPAFNVPDEKVHFNSVNYFINRLEGKRAGIENVYLRACDNQIYPEKIRSTALYPYMKDLGLLDDYASYYSNALSKVFKSPENIEDITIWSKVVSEQRIIYFIPHIIGVSLCRFLKTNQFVLYYFTCFLALIWNSSIVAFAFLKTKCNNSLLYFLGLNIGLIQQMCHFTYDGMIYSLAFAYVLFFFSFYKERKISDFVLSAICLVLLFPAKIQIYMSLGGFYILLFKKQFKALFANKKYYLPVAAIVAFSLFLLGFIYVSKNFNLYEYDSKEIGFIRTKTNVLLHPFDALLRFVYTVSVQFKELFGSLAGLVLGVRKWYVSFFCVICYFVLLYYSAADKSNADVGKSLKILNIIITLLVSLFIFAGMLVSYTNTANINVTGVQGRYFIPVLPLLLMSFSPSRLRSPRLEKNNYSNLHALQLAIPLYTVVVYLNVIAVILNVL